MPELTDVQKDLQTLTAGLKQLEAEYNMFFSGRLPRPPWETRTRVEALVKKLDRSYIQTAVDRFQFETLQRRLQTFIDLWDRGLRSREEGRPGPFAQPPSKAAPTKREPESQLVHLTAFRDPMREMDKLHTLYDSLMDARRETGQTVVPFHKFAALVNEQVTRLRDAGTNEVAFRVSKKEGKVSFTMRPAKESADGE